MKISKNIILSNQRTKKHKIEIVYFSINKKRKKMYSLNCNYFVEEFSSIDELINYAIQVGMDPNYEITRNGKLTGEMLIELI